MLRMMLFIKIVTNVIAVDVRFGILSQKTRSSLARSREVEYTLSIIMYFVM